MATDSSNLLINYVLSLLLKKIVVPSDYHNQVEAVREMQSDDVSGLVDSLTDFQINSASVDFSIETPNAEYTRILKKWLDTINKDYRGKLPSGIQFIAEQYFRERWKYSSFPVLKIMEWKTMNGLILPTRMSFVDGESIYAKDKDKEDVIKIDNYDYFITDKTDPKNKLENNCLFSRPYGRYFDKYPIPYLIKRGIYHNWKIIQSIKNKETEILDQIIPYILLIKKGFKGNTIDESKSYSSEELKSVVQQFQDLMNTLKSTNVDDKQIKSPVRATNFDEEIKHLIPDLKSIFEPSLFAVAEKSILAGLGFLDIAEGVSQSRKESILNPKLFIAETKKGVKDFKQIMKELLLLIRDKNEMHTKYNNVETHVISSPVNVFISDDFKEKIRQLYDRGRISSQTAVEIIAEVDFKTEVMRREKEEQDGISEKMFPVVTNNVEGKGFDLPNEEPATQDKNDKELPDDKVDETEKQEYNLGKKKLVGAPYSTIQSLPSYIKKKYDKASQNKWLKIWNSAYKYMLKKTGNAIKAEAYAFRTANAKMRLKVKSKENE